MKSWTSGRSSRRVNGCCAVLPTNVQLVTTIADQVLVVAEAAELQQVLLNLVTNAAHSMARGGAVSIELREIPGGPAFDGTVLADAPRVARLTVSDSGTGMNSDTLARAFEPFFTTKQPGHGTGIGLATVHTTIAALGGMVHADSELGAGTSMQVWLPMTTETASAESVIVRLRAPVPERPSAHIVVVDDEPSVLRAATKLIERLGYRVTPFERPSLLLAQLDQIVPAPQLVLTDLSMPELSGWELAAELHARVPALPIIVMTGNLEFGDGIDANGERTLQATRRDAGVLSVLSKPFTSAELRAALQQHLG